MNMCGDSLKEECDLFQDQDGGSNPTSPLQLKIKLIEKKEVKWAYIHWHYFGEKGFLSTFDFGVYFNGVLVGGISYGIPNARNIKGIYNQTTQGNFLELTRLALSPTCPKNSESRVIGITVKMVKKLKPELEGIITYADTKYNHTGIIYRASNFRYIGLTDQKTDLFVEGKPVGKLKGVKYSKIKGEWMPRSRKHLFIREFKRIAAQDQEGKTAQQITPVL